MLMAAAVRGSRPRVHGFVCVTAEEKANEPFLRRIVCPMVCWGMLRFGIGS